MKRCEHNEVHHRMWNVRIIYMAGCYFCANSSSTGFLFKLWHIMDESVRNCWSNMMISLTHVLTLKKYRLPLPPPTPTMNSSLYKHTYKVGRRIPANKQIKSCIDHLVHLQYMGVIKQSAAAHRRRIWSYCPTLQFSKTTAQCFIIQTLWIERLNVLSHLFSPSSSSSSSAGVTCAQSHRALQFPAADTRGRQRTAPSPEVASTWWAWGGRGFVLKPPVWVQRAAAALRWTAR